MLLSRIALLAPLLLASFAQAAASSDAWRLLTSLAGDWEGKMGDAPDQARVFSYQVISNGSALVETMKKPDGTPEMITVYHKDGENLMLTHYCAAGNQPRMRAGSLSADGKKIAFHFLDATNLAAPNADHMRDLTLTLPDANHLVQEWTFRNQGKDSNTVFHLIRKGTAR